MSALAAPPELGQAEWRREATRIDDVAGELARMQSELFWRNHSHTPARLLNLIVAPVSEPHAEAEVERRLATLAARQPARIIVLHAHGDDRLDADVRLACTLSPAPGLAGVCHDRVDLAADAGRLRHVDSLLRPLLVAGVPAVVWLAGAQEGARDEALARVASHLVLDTAAGEPAAALRRAADAVRAAPVHDLAWAALAWWRARVAGAFASADARRLLDHVEAIEIDAVAGSAAPALLLAGWIAARAGWPLGELRESAGRWHGLARHRFGSKIDVTVRRARGARGHGGIERVVLRAGGAGVDLRRGATTERGRDVFLEALRPSRLLGMGYAEALAALESGLAAFGGDVAAPAGDVAARRENAGSIERSVSA